MGVIAKQSVPNAFLSALGVGIGAASTLFIYPRLFDERADKWGLVQLFVSYSIVFSHLLIVGAPNVFVKYFPGSADSESRSRLSGFVFLVPLVVCSAGFGIIYAFQDVFTAILEVESAVFFQEFLIPFFLLTLVQSYIRITTGVLTSLHQSVWITALNEVGIRLLTLIPFVLFGLGFCSFGQLILGVIISYGTVFAFQLGRILSVNPGILAAVSFRVRAFGDYLRYGLVSFLDSAAAIILARIDVIMIAFFLPPEYVAIFSIAVFISNVVTLPTRAIGPAATAVLAYAWNQKDMEEVQNVYSRTAVNQMLLGALIAACILISLQDLELLLPETYRYILTSATLLVVARLFNLSFGVNGSVIVLSPLYRWNLYMNLILVAVSIITNALFIPRWGIEGAAGATLLSLVVFNIGKYTFLWAKYNLSLATKGFLGSVAFVLLLLGLSWTLGFSWNISPFVSIPLKCAVIGLFWLILVYRLRLSTDIVDYLDRWKAKMR